jgi:hypothetical protein
MGFNVALRCFRGMLLLTPVAEPKPSKTSAPTPNNAVFVI